MLASPSFHDVLNMLAPLVAESLVREQRFRNQIL
jgi:hypothetical protein